MKPRKARVALVYDFDGTLAPGTMQGQSFLPALKVDPDEFWEETKRHAQRHDMDEILAYMELMLKRSAQADTPITRAAFKGYGAKIRFFPGVKSWFTRIAAHAQRLGLVGDHFIISSGNRETIEGTAIARHFKKIFASGFQYNASGAAEWPAVAVNYTNKAQFLFRINKGVGNSHENAKVNAYMDEDERPYPFKNFIYIGDGDTDIPSMKMVTYQGGKSIVVYESARRGAKEKAHELVGRLRADIAVPADYRPGSTLETAVRAALQQIAGRHTFERSDTSPRKGRLPPK